MHHRRFVLVLVLAVVAAALLLPAVAPGDDLRPGRRPAVRQGLSAERRDLPQQPRHVAARLPPRRHGRRRRGGAVPQRKLRATGYDNVKLETVPVDEWAVRGASVTVGGRRLHRARSSPACPAPASAASPPRSSTSATASPPTTRASTSHGKIVVVDSSMDNFWFNLQGAEATKHGALAVILTSNYSDGTDMDYPSSPGTSSSRTPWAPTTASTTWASCRSST